MVWKVVKSAQPPVRYRPNSDRRPDIVPAKLQIPLEKMHYFDHGLSCQGGNHRFRRAHTLWQGRTEHAQSSGAYQWLRFAR